MITGEWSHRRSSDAALDGATLGGTGFLVDSADSMVTARTTSPGGWLATPGDFDGDGKTDAGAYRKWTGGWRDQSSSTGVQTNLPSLGGPGFVPSWGCA